MPPERPETVPDEEPAHVLHLVNPDHGGRALVLNLVERLQRLLGAAQSPSEYFE